MFNTDALSVVLQFVPPHQLFLTIPLVCSSWRNLLNSDVIWKELYISTFSASPNYFKQSQTWREEYFTRFNYFNIQTSVINWMKQTVSQYSCISSLRGDKLSSINLHHEHMEKYKLEPQYQRTLQYQSTLRIHNILTTLYQEPEFSDALKPYVQSYLSYNQRLFASHQTFVMFSDEHKFIITATCKEGNNYEGDNYRYDDESTCNEYYEDESACNFYDQDESTCNLYVKAHISIQIGNENNRSLCKYYENYKGRDEKSVSFDTLDVVQEKLFPTLNKYSVLKLFTKLFWIDMPVMPPYEFPQQAFLDEDEI
jgi:hypothetical protein